MRDRELTAALVRRAVAAGAAAAALVLTADAPVIGRKRASGPCPGRPGVTWLDGPA
jgi:isopentenyl diphosphate isomerase/L-lactate dehydrogenase-like FMN-dependent dehydrogenase